MSARIRNQWVTEKFFTEDFRTGDGKTEITEVERNTYASGAVVWNFSGYKLTANGKRKANQVSANPLYLEGDDEARAVLRMLILLEEV